MTYLDTHVILWLHDHELNRFSARAMRQLERGDLLVSPAVLLELELLYEIQRLAAGAAEIVSRLSGEIALSVCDLAFPLIVEYALAEKWVRDPFDRLIVAHARANRSALVTKDDVIRRNYRLALW